MTLTQIDADPKIQTLLDAGAAAAQPDPVHQVGLPGEDGTELARLYTVPDGYHVETADLEAIRAPYRDQPARKTGTVKVDTVDALLDYHRKHATDSAEVWVSRAGKVVDVLNAHAASGPKWGDHRAILTLQHSAEWVRWSERSGKLCSQDVFAEFLEGAAVDVLRPDMATMLEVAQSLNANTKVEFESSYRTSDGQRAFKYKETVNAKAGQRGELEIPERMTLQLRVFEGQSPQEVVARFRYRLTGDALALGFVIDRIPELLEQARLAVAMEIAERIERGIVLAGTPD